MRRTETATSPVAAQNHQRRRMRGAATLEAEHDLCQRSCLAALCCERLLQECPEHAACLQSHPSSV